MLVLFAPLTSMHFLAFFAESASRIGIQNTSIDSRGAIAKNTNVFTRKYSINRFSNNKV